MKKSKRVSLLVLLALVASLCFVACRKETSRIEEGTDTQNSKSIEIEDSQTKIAQEEANNTKEETQTNAEVTEIDIYGINEESLESEPAHAVIEGEVNATSIVDAVVKDYAAKSIDIGIYDIAQEDNKVIVSFEYGKAPLANVGSDVEETILNCISDSLMDNLEDCKAVIFRAEKDSYESGHFAFGLDEVYASE